MESKSQNEGFTLGERGTKQKEKRRDGYVRYNIFTIREIVP